MEQVVLKLLDSVDWLFLLKLITAAIVLGVAKRYWDNLSSYFFFKSNKDLSKNVRVLINGEEGFIVEINWRFIYVKLKESGNELVIPITRWTFQKWEIYKNGNQRKG